MKCLLRLVSIFLFAMLLISTQVKANQCVQCPSPSANEFVCGVDEKGNFRRFGSECLLRFENCEKKTKFQISDKALCE